MYIKTLIHVYYQHIKKEYSDEFTLPCGIGDFIRGTISLYRLSKILNFNLIVDFRHHPISNFIKNTDHEYHEIIDSNINNLKFFFKLHSLQKYIEDSFNNSNVVFLHTNSIWECDEINNTNTVNSLPVDEQEFIKNIFVPLEDFNNFINDKLSKIDINYNIIHFRCGDENFVHSENLSDYFIKEYEKIFEKYYENNDILITDNKIFKNYIKSKYNIITFDIEIGHTGYHNDLDMIRGTLFDFFLQNKAKKIKSFTIYGHISGFMLWNAKINNIPILIMNYI